MKRFVRKKEWEQRAIAAEAIVDRPHKRVNKIIITNGEEVIVEWPTTASVYETWVNGKVYSVIDGNLTFDIENIVADLVHNIVVDRGPD